MARRRDFFTRKEGGIIFNIEKGVNPTISRAVIEAAGQETGLQCRFSGFIRRLFGGGGRVERVDILKRRGKKRGSGRQISGSAYPYEKRIVINAGSVLRVARDVVTDGTIDGRSRKTIIADFVFTHERRHIAVGSGLFFPRTLEALEEDAVAYSRMRVGERHGVMF